ncbi:MAG: gliding motility-associated C-terminal domain-containing protein [Fluviicola sp.]
MRFINTLLASLLLCVNSFAQSNDCSTATNLPVTANCSTPLNGTTAGATQSIPGCSGTADDDVWYQFTATSANHQITVAPSATMDPVVQVFSGTCASLVSLVCRDFGFAGENEVLNLTGLTVGQVYRVRVYHYAAGSGGATFSICCTVGAAAPANNACGGAIPLTVNTSCVSTAGTTFGATQSFAGCAGNADDDVWYSFVATNAQQTVTVTPTSTTFDPVFQVYSGGCTTLNSEICVDNGNMFTTESSQVVGLTPGQTYFVRVYDYYAANNGNFNICVTGPATAAPTNDNPCNAIQLPTVTSQCNYLEFSNVGATTTTTPGAPSSCIGGSGAAIGGFTTGTADVWFAITVPSSGTLFITPKPNMGVGRISDGVMALYSGPNCNTLTQIVCSDDNNFPGTNNDFLPFISASGLTPGSTVYLRFFGFGTSQGAFGLCVTTTSNDNCANALYICDLNGYSASTSAAYTPDRPCNMHGNNETSAGVNQPDGTNTGGIFGGSIYDVTIENNSWIRFTASATTAVLNVSIGDCWVGNFPSGGIQMQVFSSNGSCCNFTPVSTFQESSTGFTLTASGLTVGNDYYLMVDGYAGDICNYTISAQSGVQFPQITPVAPICSGQSVVLTAPPGATSYDWEHNGSTSQSVTVTPATTQTYSVEVTGLCGYKQTLTTTVTVNPTPAAPVINTNSPICQGDNLTLNTTATGVSYNWTGPNSFSSTSQNNTIASAGTLQAGSYSLTVSQNGCTSTPTNTTVSVNTPASVNAGPNLASCNGGAVTLSGSFGGGASTVSWSGGGGTFGSTTSPTSTYTPSAGEIGAGVANLTLTTNDPAGPCPAVSDNVSIVISSSPSANFSYANSSYCQSDLDPNPVFAPGSTGGTFSSTGGLSVDPSTGIIDLSATLPGTYTVTNNISANGSCPAASANTSITIVATPSTPLAVYNNGVCEGGSLQLSTATVANATYSWNGPGSFNSTDQNPIIDPVSVSNNGTYQVVVTVNGCSSAAGNVAVNIVPLPVIDLTTIDSVICAGQSITLTASGGATYVWNTSETSSSISVSPSNTTEYFVTGTSNGCSAQDSITVTVNSLPTPVVGSDASQNGTHCMGGDATIFASGGNIYEWLGPNGFNQVNDTIFIAPVSSQNAGIYYLTVTDVNGCQNSDSIALIAAPSDFAVITGDTSLCPGETLQLTASGGDSYIWSGPSAFSATTAQIAVPQMNGGKAGTYVVVVTNQAGCIDTASAQVAIVVRPDCLTIPQLVSPNNDGHNDGWEIPGLDYYTNAEIQIFNRWGNRVYFVSPYTKTWTGEQNEGLSIDGKSERLPVGTYFYIIQLKDAEETEYKGYVELQY